MPTTTVSGSTVVFSNSTAAANLTQTGSEDGSTEFTFDVLAASGGGAKATIYSVDDGDIDDTALQNATTLSKNFANYDTDLLVKDQVGAIETTSNGGKFWIGADNQIHYSAADPALQNYINSLGVGEQFTDTFTYTIRLANGTLSVGTLTVVINGTNDAPVIDTAHTTAAGSVYENASETDIAGATASASGVIAYTDADANDTHSFAVATGPGIDEAQYGSASVDADGTWHYTVSDSGDVDALAEGETLQDSFTVRVSDNHGGFVDQVVTITITGTNDDPVIDVTNTAADGSVYENPSETDVAGASASASGVIAYTDVDANDTHSFAVATGPGIEEAQYGSASVDPDGTWHYTVSDSGDVDALQQGETLQDTFTVRVSDNHGGFVDQVVTVTITGTNDVPTFSGADTGSVTEDNNLSTGGTLSVADADHDQSAFVSTGDLNGQYGAFTFNLGTGEWTYLLDNSSGDVQNLNDGDQLTDTLTVTSTDGTTHDITVTINGADETSTDLGGPSALDFVPNQSGNAASVGNFIALGDPDANDTFTFSYSVTSNNALSATNVQVSSGGALSVNQVSTGTGDYSLHVTVTDQAGNQTASDYHVLVGSNSNTSDNFNGGSGSDILLGENGSDILRGGTGRDYLIGGAQGDTLAGGSDADVLWGGGGSDHFRFEALSDSTHAAYDTILDFTNGDSIDFANGLALTAVGTVTGGTLAAHTVAWQSDGQGGLIVYANTGGSTETAASGSDVIEIHVLGVSSLAAGDFNLHA